MKYRAMVPPHGWGGYDGVLEVLEEVRDAPAVYVNPLWRVTG